MPYKEIILINNDVATYKLYQKAVFCFLDPHKYEIFCFNDIWHYHLMQKNYYITIIQLVKGSRIDSYS